MEINEDCILTHEEKQRLLIYSKGVSHCPLHFGKDSKAGREVRKFDGREKGRFQECLDRGCWQEKAAGILTTEGILCDWLGEYI